MNYKLCPVEAPAYTPWPCMMANMIRKKYRCSMQPEYETNYKRDVVKVTHAVCQVWKDYTDRMKSEADKKQGKLF